MYLVTGTAGFIGSHVAAKLLEAGEKVVGIDNVNDYYDVTLKEARLKNLEPYPNFTFYRIDLTDELEMNRVFEEYKFDKVIHLAAQAGVRYSIDHPETYIHSNINGFQVILDCCKKHQIGHLVFASSSSIYGANTNMPFATGDQTDHPLNLYAATKKSNELTAFSYSHLFGLPATGLRIFTAYGPWGRPDMALFKFTKNILEGKPIDVYNNGDMVRDFTFVEDVAESIVRLASHKPERTEASAGAPFKVYNIASGNPVRLLEFIEAIEDKLGMKAEKNFMPIQQGDVPVTHAESDELPNAIGYRPETTVKEGVGRFVDWYVKYYKAASYS